jgi:hypothetical protein
MLRKKTEQLDEESQSETENRPSAAKAASILLEFYRTG